MKTTITLCILLAVLPLAFASIDTTTSKKGLDRELVEADTHFTYKAKPIHPGLVQAFSGWISDPWKPITISVDIAAAYDTNQYNDSDVSVEDGYVVKTGDDKEQSERFDYKWCGKLKNGVHVLMTNDSSGGSAVFGDLVFVKFSTDSAWTPEGQRYDRLLMTVVRNYSLGDRDDGSVKVLPDRVVVSKSRYCEKQEVLRFDELGATRK